MRTLTIAQMTLRLGFLIELVLGILFWTNVINPDTSALVPVHMLIGIIVVLSLWTIGLAQGFMKGSSDFGLALLTFIVGLAVIIVGLFQRQWLTADSQHWIIEVIHLLLGLAAIGVGEMVAAIAKRRVKAARAAA